MPKYEVVDNVTGKRYELEGDSPPTEQELSDIFASQRSNVPSPEEQAKLTHSGSATWESGPNFVGGNRLTDMVVGTLETPLALASGAVGSLAGLAGSVGAGLIGKSPEEAKDFRQFTTDFYSYKPQSESGKGAVNIASTLTSPLSIPRKIGEAFGGEQWGNVGDVLTLAATPKIAQSIPNIKTAVKDFPNSLRSTKSLEGKLDTVIQEGINKSVRPSYVNRSKYSTAKAYNEQSSQAVKDTIADKVNNVFERNGEIIKGENPKTLAEWADVNNNRIKRMAEERTAIDAANGESGITINGSDIAPILNDTIKNTRLADTTRKAASDIQELVGRNNNMTPAQAHELLTTLNEQATAFYQGRNVPGAEMAKVAANKLREQMAEKYAQGSQEYKTLGQQMRNALAIEKDIQKRLRVDQRANKFGFFDVANVATAADLAYAVENMNPRLALPALAIQAIKLRMKHLNSPNYQVKTMFNKAEKLINSLNSRTNGSMNLSNWSEAMKKPVRQTPRLEWKPQMSMEDVSGQKSSYVPPLPRPTTKALTFDRATTPINLGMEDVSSVRGFPAELSQPEFWSKNPDLTATALKLRKKIPISDGEMNALLQRIMINRMGKANINAYYPLSDILKNTKGLEE